MALIDNARQWARRQLAPVTVGLMAALVVGSLFFWFTNFHYIDGFVFAHDWTSRPWSILTYPFAYSGVGGIGQLIWFLVLLAWMNMTCASIERTIGTTKYAILWVLMTVIPALCIYVGGTIVNRQPILDGPLLPVAGISLIWCLRNRSMTLNLWGILPLNGIIVAIIIVAGIFFEYGLGAPLLGVFAVIYLGLAFLYADNRLPFLQFAEPNNAYRPSKQELARQAAFADEVRKRQKDREERERLRKLFEGSLNDDKDR